MTHVQHLWTRGGGAGRAPRALVSKGSSLGWKTEEQDALTQNIKHCCSYREGLCVSMPRHCGVSLHLSVP